MKRKVSLKAAVCVLFALSVIPALVTGQTTGVTAEAVGQANLRAAPDVNSALLGEIFNGTRYPVLGRSELYPWVLLGDPASLQPIGWVFVELLTIFGDLNTVPYSSMAVSAAPVSATTSPGASGPTAAPAFTVTGIVLGEINIRYGPGVNYPVIGIARQGDRLEVTAYHTQLPWVQIRYAASPTGYAWVAADLLEFEGDRFSLPAITQSNFNLPALPATPQVVMASGFPGSTPVTISPEFQDLGNRLWNIILASGFDLTTSRLGALYLQDLQTGEALTFGNMIAFSGTSINKIAILVRLFGTLTGPPGAPEAIDIANTMICSENVATNRLLEIIGNGDRLLGADLVTQFLRDLGLRNTFIAAPYDTTTGSATATPVPRALNIPASEADQTRANPDPVNQMTVDEMGWLLGSLYQCAYEEDGPLLSRFPGAFTSQECRVAIDVMANNTVDALLRAGVPASIRVAHKHGWINDTHGNAAIFFTPGGDYVLVMMLYQPEWLVFTESLPLIAEVSRTVYNYFNPQAPMEAIREGFIPEADSCNFAGSPLVSDLISPYFEATLTPRPFSGAVPTPTATPPAG